MPRKRDETQFQLGAWVRRLGLTQRQVAKDAGLGEAYVSQLISNPEKEPSVTALRALGRALGFDNPFDLYTLPPPIELSGADLALIGKHHRETRKR